MKLSILAALCLVIVFAYADRNPAWAESCPNPGLYDVDGSGIVGPADVIALIDGLNGPNSGSPLYDIDGSGVADQQDVAALLSGVAACRGSGTAARNSGESGATSSGGPLAHVTLTPSSPGPYAPSSQLSVDVFIARTAAGADIPLRLIQFDHADTDPLIGVTLPSTHPASVHGPFLFWDFSSTPLCISDATQCGSTYADFYIGSIFTAVYVGLAQDLTRQLIIPGDTTPLYVGSVDITVPALPGVYVLDLMNADGPTTDDSAQIAFSFTSTTFWRANQGDISGGTLALMVGAVPIPALGEWGLAILTLLGLIGGTILFERRRPRPRLVCALSQS